MSWVAAGTAAVGIAGKVIGGGGDAGAAGAASTPGVNPTATSKIFGQINYRTAAEIKNAAQTAGATATAPGALSSGSSNGEVPASASVPLWVWITAAVVAVGVLAFAFMSGRRK